MLFVETSFTAEFFTIVNSQNPRLWSISKFANYNGKSCGTLFSLPMFHFLDVDVKQTLEEKVATFQLYERSLSQSFEKGIASVYLTY